MGLDADKLRKLAMLRVMKEYYNQMTKTIGASLKKLESEVYENFIEEGIVETKIPYYIIDGNNNKKIVFQDRKNRNLKIYTEPRITVVDTVSLHAWLRTNNADNLIKEAVHPKTLTNFVKSRQQENKPLPNENTLKIWNQPKIKVTKT